MPLIKQRKERLMVSSSVYGNQLLLDQLYAVLSSKYEVWMSHKGTLPVNSDLSNFDNCLHAVAQCDIFLGIITGHYGSGQTRGAPGITHLEMRKAVDLGKRRFFLVHQYVDLARQFLKPYRLPPHEGPFKRDDQGNLELIAWPTRHALMDDMRVLDLYGEIRQEGVPLAQQKGNWVQPYNDDADVLRIVKAQLLT
ncbi:MAG: DUF4062 domain-containing protein [Hymenobacter sp.]|nr:MAG: DUF4062 domain-containing protein [Hymenobacter sp.]